MSTSAETASTAPAPTPVEPTPLFWRVGILVGVLVLGGATWLSQGWLSYQMRALVGVVCFLGLVFVFSANLRAIRWRTIVVGLLLQLLLALFVLQTTVGNQVFETAGSAVDKFLQFSDVGSKFVFGSLADDQVLGKALGPNNGFVFAFRALPTIIFVSSFFTILYYLGVLQFIVSVFARGMMYLMGTSGAETLSGVANVFMGQTEAPLIVKPYVEKMTDSELLALMIGGMATVSGGILAVAMNLGGDPRALLATSVMAAPCGLYVAKILLPEMGDPLTRGEVRIQVERTHRNVIDAASAGALDGLGLVLNVAAVLIAFLALLALLDFTLQTIHPNLALQNLFGQIFTPVAFLMGVEDADLTKVGELLGTKLVANELLAFSKLREIELTARSKELVTFALTSFANFSSIGIQIGGIGAMAPSRRPDLARFGFVALFGGFLVTLINAALAGVLTSK